MTSSRIAIERNEGRIELKTLKTDEWTFLENEPRYAVSVLDEQEARALLQQLITALAGPAPDHLIRQEERVAGVIGMTLDYAQARVKHARKAGDDETAERYDDTVRLFSELITRAEASSVRVLLDLNIGEANLVFSTLCFALQYSKPGSVTRAELPYIITRVIQTMTAISSFAEDGMKRWFEESEAAMSQDA